MIEHASWTGLSSFLSFAFEKNGMRHRPEEPYPIRAKHTSRHPPVQGKCRLSPCASRRPLSRPASPPPSSVRSPSRVSDFLSGFPLARPIAGASDRRSNVVAPRRDRALDRFIDRLADATTLVSSHPQAPARLCAVRPSRPAVSCRRPR